MTTSTIRRHRTWLLWLGAVRAALGIAIPLAPVPYKKHFLVPVLLRPTKEVLLAGGFLARRGDTNLLLLIAAAIPLALLGVWHFYYRGRGYAREIQNGDAISSLAERVLPTQRVRKLFDRDGERIVVVGHLASFPSALLAAAAGASGMETDRVLPADTIGGVLSLIEVIGAGYLFGEAYHAAGPWLTGIGMATLFVLLIGARRALVRE